MDKAWLPAIGLVCRAGINALTGLPTIAGTLAILRDRFEAAQRRGLPPQLHWAEEDRRGSDAVSGFANQIANQLCGMAQH
jgi:hypothetical protein